MGEFLIVLLQLDFSLSDYYCFVSLIGLHNAKGGD